MTPCIILVQPQLAANMGATARAMLNFGLSELRLVNPYESPLSPEARRLAAGADCILETAKIYPCVEDAIADLHSLYATTARSRDMTKKITSPSEACKTLVQLSQQSLKTGILFGREKSGLTNHDLSYVEHIIEIPVNPDFSSLNLAQAVLVIAYEWRKAWGDIPLPQLRFNEGTLATGAQLLHFLTRLEKELDANGFLSVPGKRDIMVRNIRNIFSRSQLTDQEVRTLHGILSSLLLYSEKKECCPDL